MVVKDYNPAVVAVVVAIVVAVLFCFVLLFVAQNQRNEVCFGRLLAPRTKKVKYGIVAIVEISSWPGR